MRTVEYVCQACSEPGSDCHCHADDVEGGLVPIYDLAGVELVGWRAPSAVVHPWALVGAPPQHRDHAGRPVDLWVLPVVEAGARVGHWTTVEAGTVRPTRIGRRTWIMSQTQIGHDTVIGDDCEVASMCNLQGHTTVGDRVKIGGGVVTRPFAVIGDDARVGAGSVVLEGVPAGEVWAGNPARRVG